MSVGGFSRFLVSIVILMAHESITASVRAQEYDWPGADDVVNVDKKGELGENLSGLSYIRGNAGEETMWAVKNSPSSLYKLMLEGDSWRPADSDGWSNGKTITYTSGTGAPDSEDLVVIPRNPTHSQDTKGDDIAIYVCSERDGDQADTSRLSVLRYDIADTTKMRKEASFENNEDLRISTGSSGSSEKKNVMGGFVNSITAGRQLRREYAARQNGEEPFIQSSSATASSTASLASEESADLSTGENTSSSSVLIATTEWDLTKSLPVVGKNLGLEAITYIPDSFLVKWGFYDEQKGQLYNPASYPEHMEGVFFVGLEGNGFIYAYVLNDDSSYAQIGSWSSGEEAIMSLEFDSDSGYLWATCDNTCDGRSNVFSLSFASIAPSSKNDEKSTGIGATFSKIATFSRPSSMPNPNNEGFAVVPDSECDKGQLANYFGKVVSSTGMKTVFWSDDSNDGGHALRADTVPCGSFI